MAETFQSLIKGEKPVLVDFTATWCGPCKMMAPVLHDLKAKVGDQLSIIKIDIDQSPQAAAAYQVQSVPTFILFKGGKILWRQSGAMPLAYLEQQLSTAGAFS
ncbi:thioredoxin [Niabella ginsenosidivorans]|uniref:Thioredoxin n=1 Tax=Niabella ginsenosidivorans TaxID=1176587 RepID=A0A1A9I8A3_9BACT|nr:thioredoxin [Niabella ginsenosidivorans]ANH83846.1 thioredoxin [Niabella ginsenosidivorans]